MADRPHLRGELESAADQPGALALMLLCLTAIGQVIFFRLQLQAETTYVADTPNESSIYFVFSPTFDQWALTGVLVAFVAGVVVQTGFYRRWMFWRADDPEPRWKTLVTAALAVALLIESFAAVSAVLAQRGWIDVSKFRHGEPPHHVFGNHPPSRESRDDAERAEIYRTLEGVYLWQFLDAVPTLKIPDTLAWDEPDQQFTETRGGLILLLFKVLVILPVLNVVVQFFTRPSSVQHSAAAGQGARATG